MTEKIFSQSCGDCSKKGVKQVLLKELNLDKTYYVLEHAVDYYPYGKVLREYTNCEEARYLTTQHEQVVEEVQKHIFL